MYFWITFFHVTKVIPRSLVEIHGKKYVTWNCAQLVIIISFGAKTLRVGYWKQAYCQKRPIKIQLHRDLKNKKKG